MARLSGAVRRKERAPKVAAPAREDFTTWADWHAAATAHAEEHGDLDDRLELLLAIDEEEEHPRRDAGFCYRSNFATGVAGLPRLDCPHPEHHHLARAVLDEIRTSGAGDVLGLYARRTIERNP